VRIVRIGEVAQRSGVNTPTIRYYEDIGLLPEPARTGSGYRDYSATAVARLSFIRAGQSTGLSLGEIREMLALRESGEQPCPHVISLLERHASDLAERIATLEQMRNDLLGLTEQARRLPPRAVGEFCHIIESARS
jgi:MerR family copper efflux transcriptional regulator